MTLAALELEVALLTAEADLLEQLIAAGILPVGARRTPSAPELAAGVRFAELDRLVNDTAALLARKAGRVRDHVLDGLAEQLAPLLDQADPYAALEALDALTDPTRGDTIPGLRQLIDDTAAEVRGDLIALAHNAADEALDEARRQGIPDRLLDPVDLGPEVEAAAAAHARRVATAPATRLLDVAAQAGARAATAPDATGATVLDGALAGAEDASVAGIEDTARQAANVTHGLGRTAAQQALPRPKEVYASELLDRNTCVPCAGLDGRLYESLEAALVDYPGAGGYVGCLGGSRCRGTLVLVHDTEAAPTIDGPGPGGQPIDRTPRGPTNPGRPAHIDADGNLIPTPPDKGAAAIAAHADTPLGMALDEAGRTVIPVDQLEPPITPVAPGEVPRDPELAEYEDHHLEQVLEDPAESLERKLAAADELDQRAAGTRTQVFREEDLDEATLRSYEDDRAAWEAAGGDVVASFVGDVGTASGAQGRRIDRVRAAWTENVEQEHIKAEAATNGYLIRKDRLAEFNAKYGKQTGSTGVLFEGPARIAYYYASPELREYWEAFERKTFAEFAMDNGVTDAKTRARATAAREARDEAKLRADENEAGREKRAKQKAEKARRRLPQTAGDRLVAAQKRRDRILAAERKQRLELERLQRDDVPVTAPDVTPEPEPVAPEPAPVTPEPAPVTLEPEPAYVDRIVDALRTGADTTTNLEAALANPAVSELGKANVRAALDTYARELEERAAAAPLEFANVGEARAWAQRHWKGPEGYAPEELKALRDYTASAYGPINNALRSSKGKRTNPQIRAMDAAMDRAARVPDNITVVRNANLRQLGITAGRADPRSIVGDELVDHGYLSTSINRTGSKVESAPEVRLNINVPAGTRAVYVSGDGGRKSAAIISDYGGGESELILDRGSRLVIKAVRKVGDRWHVDADLIPDPTRGGTR